MEDLRDLDTASQGNPAIADPAASRGGLQNALDSLLGQAQSEQRAPSPTGSGDLSVDELQALLAATDHAAAAPEPRPAPAVGDDLVEEIQQLLDTSRTGSADAPPSEESDPVEGHFESVEELIGQANRPHEPTERPPDGPGGGEVSTAPALSTKLKLVSHARARDEPTPAAGEPDPDEDGFEGAFEAPDEVDANAPAAAVAAPAPVAANADAETDTPFATPPAEDSSGGSRMSLTAVLDGVAMASSVLDRLFVTVNRPLRNLTPQTRDLVGYIGLLTFFVGLVAIVASLIFPR